MTPRLGIDFDNTIICYDAVFHRLAVEAGLLSPEAPPRQKAVRDAARRSPEGDVAWQRLQGQAYGPRIQEATPAPGILAFLSKARRAGFEVHIISHKTRFASIDPTGTDLQAAAAAWLARHGFFSEETGLDPSHFHCGVTRQEKVALIRNLGCTHFVDDLVETFREAAFPSTVQPILYAPGGEPAPEDLPHLWVARSWDEVARRIHLV
ncbi:hypothetical protein GETHLI_16720 [Geothrix limicola]|uniref:Haloacid dehalogenase-like hydrolase n=1 Tax=Geothrix limicola TaxID=2927978 RepID=A0ABQ5QFE9_9BACT|nr:hypothetical protein [Geothrix limicola]GLH73170.1 hypothetical protein GETHLI_16720 [Geothrix limicola]